VKHGIGALFGLLLALPVAARASDVARGPQRLFRRLESNAKNAGNSGTFIDEAYLEAYNKHKADAEHRKLNFFQADVPECKRYCQRNYDDVIGYKCSVCVFIFTLPYWAAKSSQSQASRPTLHHSHRYTRSSASPTSALAATTRRSAYCRPAAPTATSGKFPCGCLENATDLHLQTHMLCLTCSLIISFQEDEEAQVEGPHRAYRLHW
jgi:hypothetical protein